MRILVSGGQGQLAKAIQTFWKGHELVVPPEAEFDLTDPASVRRTLDAVAPQVVVNAGAFTQVDLCESEPEKARLVNGTAVGWLAEGCARHGALLVQVSTDYVFDGAARRPYREEEPPGPATVYGRTKLLGEEEARKAPEHLVVRTAWLYEAWGRNFLGTMLGLAGQGKPIRVVDDQWGTPTTCRALARQLQTAVDAGVRGTLHATCAGETTWFGFTEEIFRQYGIQADLKPCSTADFPRPAKRPAYSVLDGGRRRALGIDRMPAWQDALSEIVTEAKGT